MTRFISEGETFKNDVFTMAEAIALDHSCQIEIQRVQVEELSTRNSIISLIQALYEIRKHDIINCYVSQMGLTSGWEDSAGESVGSGGESVDSDSAGESVEYDPRE